MESDGEDTAALRNVKQVPVPALLMSYVTWGTSPHNERRGDTDCIRLPALKHYGFRYEQTDREPPS